MKNYIPNWIFTKTFLKIALPVILGQMLISAVSFLDNFMVGNLSNASTALTSVMIVNELLFIAVGLAFGVSAIGDIFGAQFFGAKMIDKFKETLKLKVLLNVVIALIALTLLQTVPGFFISFFINKTDPQRDEIIKTASEYARIMVIGHILFSISSSFVGSLTIVGHPKYYFYSCLASLLFNGLFNYVFMYVLNLGVKGAAYSTLLARGLELILIFVFVFKHRDIMFFGWNIFAIHKKLFIGFAKKSQLIISQVAMTIGLTGQTMIWTNEFPEIKSGLGIGYAVSGMLWTIIAGLGSASRVIIGHQLGEGKLEESWVDSKKILFLGGSISVLIASIMASLSFVFPLFFTKISSEAGNAMSNMILFFSILLPFWTISSYFFSLFETGGFTRASTILGSYYVLFVVLPFSFVVAHFSNAPFWAVFFAANSLHAVTNILCSWPIYKRKKWLRNIANDHENEINIVENV